MRAIYLVVMLVIIISSCNTTKNKASQTADSTMKANLIDGVWQVNFIMNTPKPIEELFPMEKPTITFDSFKSSVTGRSGCNYFNGKCSINGHSIKIDEAMAVTRKMCVDRTGEQIFLETLKKINTYSVTNQGKTLNLIMGDMAVMRLEKKIN
ncbi:META domain-containing protein [Flavobacterium sp. RSSA_27]|uniref:META domain-containing protein n=1 Tax=Flavobacterium sp. RSSA_27 TaxID=3447667 RepID=UPI003F38B45E